MRKPKKLLMHIRTALACFLVASMILSNISFVVMAEETGTDVQDIQQTEEVYIEYEETASAASPELPPDGQDVSESIQEETEPEAIAQDPFEPETEDGSENELPDESGSDISSSTPYEEGDTGTPVPKENETTVLAEEETTTEAVRGEKEEVLDPEKIEGWKEGLRDAGFDETDILLMEDSLYAKPGSLQYLINERLIEDLSTEVDVEEEGKTSQAVLVARVMTTAPLSVISLGALPTADAAGMIILQDDYTETLVVPQGVDITIDLNGHAINLPFGAEETELIRLYGALTLIDSAGGGTINGYGSVNTRGVLVTSGGSFTMNGGTICNFATEGNGGGVYVENGRSFVMNGGSIENCSAAYYGGGLYVYDAATTSFNGGTVSGNTAENGGGIALNTNGAGRAASAAKVFRTTVTGNTADNYGGGIYADSSINITLTNTQIDGNTANAGGGLFFMSASTLTVDSDSTVNENVSVNNGAGIRFHYNAGENDLYVYGHVDYNETTAGSGGGVYIDASVNSKITSYARTTVLIDGGHMDYNKAFGVGAAVYVNSLNQGSEKNDLIIQNNGSVCYNQITGNATSRVGGGIRMGNRSRIYLYSGKINGNSGATHGGGIGVTQYNNTFYIYDGFEVKDNRCIGVENLYGGGIYGYGITAFQMTGGEVCGNIADTSYQAYGGGIYLNGSGITFSGGKISDNTVSGQWNSYGAGGGYYGSAATFTGDIEVSGNYATGEGGGIRCTGNLTLSGSALITGNETGGNGGGVYCGGTLTINDSVVISYNSAKQGGGIFGSTVMNGGEICFNNVVNYGGGVRVNYPTSVFRMLGGSIHDNTAGSSGGGMALNVNTKNNIIKGDIYNNESGNVGGAFYIERYSNGYTTVSKLTIEDGANIYDNTAADNGGAVYIGIWSAVEMTGGVVKNNHSGNYGGGFASINGNVGTNIHGRRYYNVQENVLPLKITGGSVYDNTAVTRGNDIYNTMTKYDDVFSLYSVAAASELKDCNSNSYWYSENTAEYLSDPLDNTEEANQKIVSGESSLTMGGFTFVERIQAVAKIGETEYETVQAAINALEAGENEGTIVMIADSIEDIILPAGLDVTVDLAGFTIHGLESCVFFVPAGSSLTIEDSSEDESGKITGGRGLLSGSTRYGSAVYTRGRFVLNGGSLTGNHGTASTSAVWLNAEDASMEMNGGSITNNRGSGVRINGNTIHFVMNGGTISDNTESGVMISTNTGIFTMNGGEIKDNLKYGVQNNRGQIIIHDGTISGNEMGGIYIYADHGTYPGKLTMDGGTVSRNTGANGAGLYLYGHVKANISGGTISGNYGTSSGGGIYFRPYANAVFTLTSSDEYPNGPVITGNRAKSIGGIYCGGASSTVTNYTCRLENAQIYDNHSENNEANDMCIDAYVYNFFLLSASDMGLSYNCWKEGITGDEITTDITELGIKHLTASITTDPDMSNAVARIGSTVYPTLQSAINAARQMQEEDDTQDTCIHLLTDIEESVSVPDGDIRVNLNGYTITPAGSNVFYIVRGNLTVCDDDTQEDYNAQAGSNGFGGSALTAGDTQQTRAAVVRGGSFTLESGTIDGFNGSEYGGAVFAQYYDATTPGIININGGVISNCSATKGGAISISSATLNMAGGEIRNCHADVNGGAVYAEPVVAPTTASVQINVSGGVVHDCDAGASGGGFCLITSEAGNTNYTTYGGSQHLIKFTGGTIYSCTCHTGSGGGIYARGNLSTGSNDYTVQISGMEIYDCVAEQGSGGGIIAQYGQKKFKDLYIHDCEGAYGGAVYLTTNKAGWKAEFEDCVFNNNFARHTGGAVYSTTNTVLQMERIEAHGNSSEYRGGAIGVYSGGAHLTDITLTDNFTNGYGGAICSFYDDLTIDGDSVISGNSASTYGGAIYYSTGTTNRDLNISGVTFSDNKAAYGGAMYWYDHYNSGTRMVDDCIFRDNTSVSNGGAIYASMSRNVPEDTVFTNTLFENNNAGGAGGAVEITNYSTRAAVTFGPGTVFQGNTAKSTSQNGGGGAVYAYVSEIIINGAEFKDNESGAYGGAVSAHLTRLTVNDGLFTGNSATYGGAINCSGTANNNNGTLYSEYARLNLNGGTFMRNYASISGGAIYNGNYSHQFYINGAVIKENQSGNYGGGVYCTSVDTICTLQSGQIYSNTSGIGQDVYVAYSKSYVTSNIDLIAARDMFTAADEKEGIGWFDETTLELLTDKVQAHPIMIQAYPLTLRFKETKIVAVIGEEEFTSVQEAVQYIATGVQNGTIAPGDIPEIKMVDDSTECVEIPGTINAVLNLNGHTLTGNGSTAITVSGTIEIIDRKEEGDETSGEETGTITGTNVKAGGGVRVVNGGSATMSSGQISGCRAGNNNQSIAYGGAAVCVEDGTFELTGTASLNNNKAGNGAAVMVTTSAGTFKMSGGYIEENQSTQAGSDAYGGIIYNYAGKTVISGGEIRNNKSTFGTVMLNTGTLSIAGNSTTKPLIHDNSVASKGGGVYVYSGTATIGTSEIYNNRVTNARTSDATVSAGGGVYVNAGNLNIVDGAYIHNNSAQRGGGVYIKSGNAKMMNGRIVNNSAQIGGGVTQYWGRASTFNLSNGLIANNHSILYSAGNDIYSAYEGTAAGLENYLKENTTNHPKTTLTQAKQMGSVSYNVWRDDDYEGNEETGEYVLIKTDAEDNAVTSYIGEAKYLTGYITNSQNLQLTADYYDVSVEEIFDNDMHVAGVQAVVVTDGTAKYDDGTSGLPDASQTEITAAKMVEDGFPGFSYDTQTYTYKNGDTTVERHYIRYTGSEYTEGLYEQEQAVVWDPGNDLNGHNGVVRTYDSLTYGVTVSIEPDDSLAESKARKIRYWIEAELPCDSSEADFSTSSLSTTATGYVVMTGVNEHGQSVQKLQAYYDLNLGEDQDAYSSTQNIGINVYAMKNGDIIRPTFRAWVDGNTANEQNLPELIPANFIRVSAQPRYNTTIDYNNTLSYVGYFNILTGAEVSETEALDVNGELKPNIVYGVIAGYGVTASLYNQDGKALKGIELPLSPLEFDVRFSGSLWLNGEYIADSDRGAYLWAYKENDNSDLGRALGSDYSNRNMNWNDEDDLDMTTRYAYNAAPFNSGGGSYSCYSGGSWQITGSQFTGSDEEAVYHVTASRFAINNNNYPNYASDKTTGTLFNAAYIKPFTAGYIQVLYPVDRDVEVSGETYLSIEMHAAITGFEAESVTGQPAVSADDDTKGINALKVYFNSLDAELGNGATHEVKYGDNYCAQSSGLYLYDGDGNGDLIDKYNDFLASNQASIAGDTGQGNTSLNSQIFIRSNVYWYSAEYRTDDEEKDPVHYIAPEDFNTQTDNVLEKNYMTALNILQKFDADVFTPLCETEVINQQFTSATRSFGGGNYHITSSETSTSWSNDKTLSGNFTVLYAAKPDGSNWTKVPDPEATNDGTGDVWEATMDNTIDNDGGTAEMDLYTDENLLYFRSMQDLKDYFAAQGKEGVCVALLYEFRDICIRDARNIGVNAKMQVTNEFNKVGHTYETTNDVRSWSTYRHTYKEYYRKNNAYAGRQALLYTHSYLEDDHGDGSYGPQIPAGNSYGEYEYKTLYVPEPEEGYEHLWTAYSAEKYAPGYVKTEYLYGNKAAGTHTGWKSGNNLLLYTLVSSIRIRNTDRTLGSNTEKETYNVSVGERTANYVVEPDMYIASAVQNHELITNGTQMTAVEITLDLDEGLHYNPGTINFDYSESAYNDGELEWNIQVVNENGKDKVVLTTTVYDIAKKLPTISFNTTIGDVEAGENDVVNGESLTVKASIRAKYTSINQIAADSSSDQTTIKVAKNSESAISKTVKETIVEVGEDMEYRLRLYNLTADRTNFHFGDVLPYNGDKRGTSFEGAYRVKEITLKFISSEDYSAFVDSGSGSYLKVSVPDMGGGVATPNSESDMYRIIAAAGYADVGDYADVNYDAGTNTVTYTFNNNSIIQKASDNRGIAFSGYFPSIQGSTPTTPSTGVRMNIVMTAVDNDPDAHGDSQLLKDGDSTQTGNNIYSNAFFYQDGNAIPVNSSTVSITTIMRVVSGRVWLDQDQDGLYTRLPGNNSSDRCIRNVKVTLKEVNDQTTQATYTDAINILGNVVQPVYTDENGYYSFTNLAPGKYQVFFEDCDLPGETYMIISRDGESFPAHPIPFSSLSVTDLQTGYVQGNKSNAEYMPDNTQLKDGTIHTTITLPEKADMTSPLYSSPNWNLGLYYIEMSVEKEWKDLLMHVPADAGVDFTFTGTVGADEVLRRTYTVTQREDGTVSYTMVDENDVTYTDYAQVTETADENGLLNIRWVLPTVPLQAENANGTIEYAVTEAIGNATRQLFTWQGIDNISFDMSVSEPTVNQAGLTTITATNRMIENSVRLEKIAKESLSSATPQALTGAEFALLTAEPTGNTAVDDANRLMFINISAGNYRLSNVSDRGNGTVTLATDEDGILMLTDLPEGTYYLKETKAPADRILPSGWWIITIGADNSINVQEASVDGENDPDPMVSGGDSIETRQGDQIETLLLPNEKALTVSKVVTGSMGSRDYQFEFVLIMPGEPENVYFKKGDTTGTVTWTNGRYVFTLSHGDSITFGNLLSGEEYTVQETDANKHGYTTSSEGETSGIFVQETSITFTNDRNIAVPTSLNDNGYAIAGMAVFGSALAAFIWLAIRRKIKGGKKTVNKPLKTISSSECPAYGAYTVYDEKDHFLGRFGSFVTAKDIAQQKGNYMVFDGQMVIEADKQER